MYLKVEKGNRILVRVGGGYIAIEEFINQYTDEEVEKIARRDVLHRFVQKAAVQAIAAHQSVGSREQSPIRSP